MLSGSSDRFVSSLLTITTYNINIHVHFNILRHLDRNDVLNWPYL